MKVKAQIDRFIGKDNRIKAYASVILGGEYVIRDIAVKNKKNGLFARMPYRSYKDRNGNMQYSDVAFALNETSRNAVNDAVLEAYEQRLQMEEDESQGLEDQEEDEAPVFAQGDEFVHRHSSFCHFKHLFVLFFDIIAVLRGRVKRSRGARYIFSK